MGRKCQNHFDLSTRSRGRLCSRLCAGDRWRWFHDLPSTCHDRTGGMRFARRRVGTAPGCRGRICLLFQYCCCSDQQYMACTQSFWSILFHRTTFLESTCCHTRRRGSVLRLPLSNDQQCMVCTESLRLILCHRTICQQSSCCRTRWRGSELCQQWSSDQRRTECKRWRWFVLLQKSSNDQRHKAGKRWHWFALRLMWSNDQQCMTCTESQRLILFA